MSPAFTATSAITPAAGATSLTVPLPPSTGYSGQAIFPVASLPPNLKMTITYTDRAPAGVSALATTRRTASELHALVATPSTPVAYACFAANYLVNITGPPQFSFSLPPGFALSSYDYNLSLEQNGPWTTGYGGPGIVVASASAAVVSLSGRFGFTLPANVKICVALSAQLASEPTPIPATPAPIVSPSPVPSASPSPSPTPIATPTGLYVSPGMLTLQGVGATFALTASVNEAGYVGPFTIAAPTCEGIATISPGSGSGPALPFTVTGVAAGTCTATATDLSAQIASLQIVVTTTSIGVNARRHTP